MAKATRFTQVHLKNWRNFADITVYLANRVFLVGPNAAGKSNLLDVFRFLHDIVVVGGGFQAAVAKRGGPSKVRALTARRSPDLEVRVCVGNDDVPNAWEYELHFGNDKGGLATIRHERVARGGADLLNRPDDEDSADPKRLSQTYLEQINANREFREVADFFASVRYLHIVPQLVREPDRSVGRSNDPYGGDFLEQMAHTPLSTQRARLRRIGDALRVAVPQLKDLELWRDARGVSHLRGKYEHWRMPGAWQTEEQFSDGTLRLAGLLWAVLGGEGPLLLEEPELYLHPEVVRFIPQMFARIQRRSGRQIFVSTHSSDLLRDEGIGLDEVLLLQPEQEGTVVRPANAFAEIRSLLESGLSLPEAVMPQTSPKNAQRLSRLGD